MAARPVAYLSVALALITQAEAQAPKRSQDLAKAPSQADSPGRKAPEAQALREPIKPRPGALLSAITLGDVGFGNGFRFANLAGRRELFVPLPQGADIAANELVLVVDDVSAHEARRSLEILLNDRSVASIALEGNGQGRTVRIPLGAARAREGFLKFSFLYSGAATQDRCIDVRYVGDSVTVRPESAVELDIAFAGSPDVATTAALMPRDVTVVLPRRRLEPADLAAALTVARSLMATGRRVAFHHGFEGLKELAKHDGQRWTRGIIVVGSLQEVLGYLDAPVATVAGTMPAFGALLAARIGGLPVLVVSDATSVRASRLLASPTLNATRGLTAASVGTVVVPKLPTGQISFDRLGIVLPQAEVFGRADLPVTIDTQRAAGGHQARAPGAQRHGRARWHGGKGGRERPCQRAPGRQRGGGDGRTDAARLCVGGRSDRHHRQRAGHRSAAQRPGRLPVRAAGLPGADSGIERGRLGARERCRT
jgi:hypothetical protein